MLSRRYAADLCYTPMFNAKLFAKDVKYRDEHWAGLKDGIGGGGPNDRPLIVQVQNLLFLPSFVSLVLHM